MSTEHPRDTSATNDGLEAQHAVTYFRTRPGDGEEEAGDVLLDQRPIGRLSRRRRLAMAPQRADASRVTTDMVWHAEAVGWLPHEGRPWDKRITSSAPTRQRAAEDLLRAYRNHR